MRDFTTEQSKKYFGANVRKAKANYDKEFKRAKREKIYPYADITNFKFQIILLRDGEISSSTKIYHFDENGANWEIGSVAFGDFFTGALYWVRQKFGTLRTRVRKRPEEPKEREATGKNLRLI